MRFINEWEGMTYEEEFEDDRAKHSRNKKI